MKMCHLQLLHTFGILEKYWTNPSQSRFKKGRVYLNALYNYNTCTLKYNRTNRTSSHALSHIFIE